MKKNIKIYLVVVCMFLGTVLILKINNYENQVLTSKGILHGTYT